MFGLFHFLYRVVCSIPSLVRELVGNLALDESLKENKASISLTTVSSALQVMGGRN